MDDGTGIAVRRYEAIDLQSAMQPPSAVHVLGTDRFGRDLLARCLLGGTMSLSIGMSAAFISVVIGTLYGAVAGARGGWSDSILMRIVDLLYGIPTILLVVLLAVGVNGLADRMQVDRSPFMTRMIDVTVLIAAIGGTSWLTMARVVRGQVLSLRARPFMEACRAIGVSPIRQFSRHLLPNLAAPVAVYAALAVPAAILSESFLSFLGIGVREPLPSWGNLAGAGLSELNLVESRWWMLVWPCALVALTLVALNFLGDELRERFDPASRGRS